MSMFSKIEQLKNAPFTDGPFMLFTGDYEGFSEHPEYGRNYTAKVTAGPKGSAQKDAETFVVYGVLAEQIGRMTGSDLPCLVMIEKDGRSNVFRKAE